MYNHEIWRISFLIFFIYNVSSRMLYLQVRSAGGTFYQQTKSKQIIDIINCIIDHMHETYLPCEHPIY